MSWGTFETSGPADRRRPPFTVSQVRIRNRIAMLAFAVVVVAVPAGCGTTPQLDSERRATSSPSAVADRARPSPSDTRTPVANAGGVCELLSYQLVAETTGVDFDVAAAGPDGTSCALQVLGHEYPDLRLTSAATKADAESFAETIPDGAAEVGDLGDAAYRVVLGGEDGSGPRAEVGWLSQGKIYILRYSFEPGASEGQAEQMSHNLVTLARRLRTG